MRIFRLIYIILVSLVLFPSHGLAKKQLPSPINKPELPDSILGNIIYYAPFYEKIVEEYSGEMYMKGRLDVKKKNSLLRVVPSMFKPEKGVHEYIVETMNEIHYKAPDIYDVKVKAVAGTTPKHKGMSEQVKAFFRMNIYSSSLLSEKLYSPLALNARSYYTYYLDSVYGPGHHKLYKVLIEPRNKSSQLVRGYFVVSAGVWTIREMYIEGETDFLKFKVKTEMGEEGDEEFLAKSIDVDIFFNFVGNKIDGSFNAYYKYDDVRLAEKNKKKARGKTVYDLTEYFSLTLDSTTTFSDSAYFAKIRPIPLEDREEKLYRDFALRRDTAKKLITIKTPDQLFFGRLGDVLLSNYTVDMADLGSVRMSPLLNPLLFSYSHNDGFSYRQEFKYNRRMGNERFLRLNPKMGYNFTHKEFYWSLNGTFDYWPKKRASFSVNVGNGNRIYSSDVLDDIKHTHDSIFDFDNLELRYFKDMYLVLNHDIEILNGFRLITGFIAHRRTPVGKVTVPSVPDAQIGDVPERSYGLQSRYISIAPRVRLELTPGLYYYMNGNRKVNLHSRFPTFSVDWEKGIKGIFGSTGKYERLEFDMQHQIRLELMKRLFYRVGLGGFTDQEQMYFVDFANFSRSNLPVGWNDDIGGVFQLLDRRWYNSSMSYVRGHITYESPFLIWPHLSKYTSLIDNERIYLNVLFVPHLTPYIEFGYGVGTHIFDFGIFVNNVNGRFRDIGAKFTFELFNK